MTYRTNPIQPSMVAERELNFELASDPSSIHKIESIVSNFCKKWNIRSELHQDILLVLTEAVTNSIHHGNCLDPGKKVYIKCRLDKGQLKFTVKDQGKGFNHLTIPDCTCPSRLLEPGGRGVHIMKSLSNDLNYYDNGRTVEIKFRS